MARLLKVVLLLIICLQWTPLAHAQIFNVGDLVRSGVDDANLLINEYLRPLGNGFGADLNNGWFNTARTHKFLGFDITVSANTAIAPTSDETFDISSLGLKNMRPLDAGNTITPTIVGSEDDGPEVEIFIEALGQQMVVDTLKLPPGIGFRYVPSPMIQASVGLFANTDVILRFFPEVEFEKDIGSLRMFGVGVKHDLTQWLPGGGLLPFDLSVAAGVTTFQAQANLDVPPDPNLPQTGDGKYDNQEVEVEAKSFNLNVLISKKFAILTLFGGVGIESSTVDLKLKGDYPIPILETDINSPNFSKPVTTPLRNPVNLSFDGANETRVNVGARLNLAILAISASYTFSKYPVFTLGAGLSIR
ncbi:MAG: DUF6588 family protein [bacterium]